MSPISREREYARRRYEKWQTKQAVRIARQRRQRKVAVLSVTVVVAVLGVTGVVLAMTGSGGEPDATTAAASPSAQASASGSPSTADASNPCPAPTMKPPAKPQSFSSAPDASLAKGRSWTFTMTTSCGDIVATLDGAKAPKAVANAIFLSEKKFWDGSPCHRLGGEGLYMLQCGDPTGTGTGGPGYAFGPIENAPADQVYKAGTLAMARSSSLTSQGSQFFLVFKDTTLPDRDGYTVFGHITKGLDVLTKVAEGGVPKPGLDGSGEPGRPISLVSTAVSPG